MKAGRLLLLLALLSPFFPASAFGACPEAPTSPLECKGRILITNKTELQNYLIDFGINKKQTAVKSAHISGSVIDQGEGASFHLATPCGIQILENTTLDIKGEVCLVSGKSVQAKPGFTLKADTATLKAPNLVVIRDNFNGVITGDLNLLSTGSSMDSRAHIRHTSNVQAANLTLKALRRATLGHTSVYNVAGKVSILSNGEDLPEDVDLEVSEWSSIWRDTTLNVGTLEIIATDKVRVAQGVNVLASAVTLDGKACKIAKNTAFESSTKTGSCFSGLMPDARFVSIPKKEVNLNEPISLDASRSIYREGAKFIWSVYNNPGKDQELIQTFTTTEPLLSTSFSTLGDKKIVLKVESIEGYYDEASRRYTVLSSNPLPPVASLTANPNQGEVPLEITLDASGSTDSDGTIVKYIFSDGTNVAESSGPTLTFIQETPGTFNYTVEVVDSQGLKSQANATVTALPKTTDEESALLSFYKYNLIPNGSSFELELIFEGRSLNGKQITEAFYSTPEGDRLDVGRKVLGHKDVVPFDSQTPVPITLTIKDELGGSQEYTHTIDIFNQNPVLKVDYIEFSPNQLVFFSNLFFDPQNKLDGFESFRLDFGDGQFQEIARDSFQLNHQYAEAGEYQVSLLARGYNGQEYTYSETVDVKGNVEGFEFPLADFRVIKEGWAPGVRLVVDQSLSPLAPIQTYLWNLGDGTTAYGSEVIHFYQSGVYDVTLTVVLADGTQATVKREVVIMNDAPNIVSNIDCVDIGNLNLECAIVAVDKFSDLSKINIHFGDSEILPENIISQNVSGQVAEVVFTHPYTTAGNYQISYQIETSRGEDLVREREFSVTDAPGNLPPVASFNCFASNLFLDCNAFGSYDPDGMVVSYEFSLGNGITLNEPQFFYQYAEPGSYVVSLKVIDNFGLESTTFKEFTLNADPFDLPVAHITCTSEGLLVTCSGNNSYNPKGGALAYEFTYSGQILSNESSFQVEVPETGTYLVELTVRNDLGLSDSTSIEVDAAENSSDLIFPNLACKRISREEIYCSAGKTVGENLNFSWRINSVDIGIENDNFVAQVSSDQDTDVELQVSNNVFTKNIQFVIPKGGELFQIDFNYFVSADQTLVLDASKNLGRGLEAVSYKWYVDNGIIYESTTFPRAELAIGEVFDKVVKLEITFEDGTILETSKNIAVDVSNIFSKIEFRYEQPLGKASKAVSMSIERSKGLNEESYAWFYNGELIENSENQETINFTFPARGSHEVRVVLNNGNSEKIENFEVIIEEINFEQGLKDFYKIGDKIFLSISNLETDGIEASLKLSGEEVFLVGRKEFDFYTSLILPTSEGFSFGNNVFEFLIDGSTYFFEREIIEPHFSGDPINDYNNLITEIEQKVSNSFIKQNLPQETISEVTGTIGAFLIGLRETDEFQQNPGSYEYLIRNLFNDLKIEESNPNVVSKNNRFINKLINLFINDAYAFDLEENTRKAISCGRGIDYVRNDLGSLSKLSLITGVTSSFLALLEAAPSGIAAVKGGALVISLGKVAAVVAAVEFVFSVAITQAIGVANLSLIEPCSQVFFPLKPSSQQIVYEYDNFLRDENGVRYVTKGLDVSMVPIVKFGQLFNNEIITNGSVVKYFRELASSVNNVTDARQTASGTYNLLLASLQGSLGLNFLQTLRNLLIDIGAQQAVNAGLFAVIRELSTSANGTGEARVEKNFQISSSDEKSSIIFRRSQIGDENLVVNGERDVLRRSNLRIILNNSIAFEPVEFKNILLDTTIKAPCGNERMLPPINEESGLISRGAILNGRVELSPQSVICGGSRITGTGEGVVITGNSTVSNSIVRGDVSINNSTVVNNSIIGNCSRIEASNISAGDISGASVTNSNLFKGEIKTINKDSTNDSQACNGIFVSAPILENVRLISDYNGPILKGFTEFVGSSITSKGTIAGLKSLNSVVSLGSQNSLVSLSGVSSGSLFNIEASQIAVSEKTSFRLIGAPSISSSTIGAAGVSGSRVEIKENPKINNSEIVFTGSNNEIVNGEIKDSSIKGVISLKAPTINRTRITGNLNTHRMSGNFSSVDCRVGTGNTISIRNFDCKSTQIIGPSVVVIGKYSNSEIFASGPLLGNIISSKIYATDFFSPISNKVNQSCISTSSGQELSCCPFNPDGNVECAE